MVANQVPKNAAKLLFEISKFFTSQTHLTIHFVRIRVCRIVGMVLTFREAIVLCPIQSDEPPSNPSSIRISANDDMGNSLIDGIILKGMMCLMTLLSLCVDPSYIVVTPHSCSKNFRYDILSQVGKIQKNAYLLRKHRPVIHVPIDTLKRLKSLFVKSSAPNLQYLSCRPNLRRG